MILRLKTGPDDEEDSVEDILQQPDSGEEEEWPEADDEESD